MDDLIARLNEHMFQTPPNEGGAPAGAGAAAPPPASH